MRKVTATMAAANAVISATGMGWMKFNDKLKDGRRSLKVFGWTRKEYMMALDILHMAGHDVEIVEFTSYNFRAGSDYVQTRLHVTEK